MSPNSWSIAKQLLARHDRVRLGPVERERAGDGLEVVRDGRIGAARPGVDLHLPGADDVDPPGALAVEDELTLQHGEGVADLLLDRAEAALGQVGIGQRGAHRVDRPSDAATA